MFGSIMVMLAGSLALLSGSALACDKVAYVLQFFSRTPYAQVAKVYRLLLQAMLPDL